MYMQIHLSRLPETKSENSRFSFRLYLRNLPQKCVPASDLKGMLMNHRPFSPVASPVFRVFFLQQEKNPLLGFVALVRAVYQGPFLKILIWKSTSNPTLLEKEERKNPFSKGSLRGAPPPTSSSSSFVKPCCCCTAVATTVATHSFFLPSLFVCSLLFFPCKSTRATIAPERRRSQPVRFYLP